LGIEKIDCTIPCITTTGEEFLFTYTRIDKKNANTNEITIFFLWDLGLELIMRASNTVPKMSSCGKFSVWNKPRGMPRAFGGWLLRQLWLGGAGGGGPEGLPGFDPGKVMNGCVPGGIRVPGGDVVGLSLTGASGTVWPPPFLGWRTEDLLFTHCPSHAADVVGELRIGEPVITRKGAR